MANPIKKIFEYTLLYQIILFLIFILENYATLDKISVHVVILEFDTTIVINFYLLVSILALIYGGLVLLGINVLGSGLSDSGLNKMSKFLRLIFIYLILSVASFYYFQFIYNFTIIIQIIILAIYLLFGLYDIGSEQT